MRASHRFKVAALVVAALALPSAGGAQSGGSCRDDVREFCRNIEPRRSAQLRCLQEHAADLSSACRAHLQEQGERRAHPPRDARTPRGRHDVP
jgi:hypothetical protein